MKKKLVALLCAVALLLCLAPAVSGASDLWMLSINETIPELSTDTIPIMVSGTLYVPCTVFDSRVTGINLNVYYGVEQNIGTVSIFSKEKTVAFDIGAGTATDYTKDVVYPYQAITRNGQFYVPIVATCQLFDLDYSKLTTDYGMLLRIKNSDVVLDDRTFVSVAGHLLSARLRQYGQPSTGSQEETVTPVDPVQTEEEENHSGTRVYMAIAASAENMPGILDMLETQNRKVLILFRPEELAAQDDLVRRAVGLGHQVGMICAANTAQAAQEELEQGNALLARIARIHTYIVWPEAGGEVTEALEASGWLCYQPNVTVRTENRSSRSLAAAVARAVDARAAHSRILLDEDAPAVAVTSIFQNLAQAGYDIRRVLETNV